MYDCPFLHFFDLLIMIKLVGVWWLVVAQWRVPRVLYYTKSHLGPEKKKTKQSEDVKMTEEAWRQCGLMGKTSSSISLSVNK